MLRTLGIKRDRELSLRTDFITSKKENDRRCGRFLYIAVKAYFVLSVFASSTHRLYEVRACLWKAADAKICIENCKDGEQDAYYANNLLCVYVFEE